MSNLFWQVLSAEQKQEFKKLKVFSNIGIMAGGTALSLEFNHRRSYDLDIFVKKELRQNFILEIRKVFGRNIELLRDSPEELTFITSSKVKITFVYYPFKSVYPLSKTDSISLFSWKDIALDKAYTIGRRPQYRDYVDLFFIIRKNMSLKEIIQNAEKKFGGLFSEKLFLGQLIYFEDIKDFKIEFLKEKFAPEEIKDFLIKKTKEYTKDRLM